MSERAIDFCLYGDMAEKYGSVHPLYVQSPADAIRIMGVNYPGFLADLAGRAELFLVVDDRPQAADSVLGGVRESVALVPVEMGAKEGWQTGLIIAGAALLAATGVGLVFGGVGGAGFMGTTGLAAYAANSLMYFGISYALSAAVAYATRNDDVKDPDATRQTLGSTFGGAINATQAGLPVPVGYGRLRVGSFQLTTSITPVDRPDLLAQGL